MAIPTTRAEFKETCLRRLGKGAIRIEITDDQTNDLIDTALAKARDYHFDFSEMQYYKIHITDDIKTNGYIDLPETTIGAIEIFDLSSTIMGGGIFNAQYQFVLNNVWEWQSSSLVPYFVGFQHMQLIEQILVGKQPIRYNRYQNRLYVDMDWTRVTVGQWIIAKVYQYVDPETNPKLWSDYWLTDYTAALFKRQWASNLKKYKNLPLTGGTGGITFDAQDLFDEAQKEIDKLELQLVNSFSIPASDFIG